MASFLCPPKLRPAIAAIYWFARTADDIADEGDADAHMRLADLAAYHEDLRACAATPVSRRWAAVFVPLKTAIAQFEVPVQLLADLLSAFEQDVVKIRYASQWDVLDYCAALPTPWGSCCIFTA